MNESLREKLKSLGVQLGASGIKPGKPKNTGKKIEQIIDGNDIQTPFGNVFVAISDYPPSYQHGKVRFDRCVRLKWLAAWGKTPGLEQNRLEEIVFLDTETSGLAGGAGTFAFMAGVGSFTNTGFQVRQFFLRDPSQELPFLAGLLSYLHPFKTVVTFNGKSFDIPLMNNRYILSRLGTPFDNMEHIDLLHLARRLWRNRLEKRALGDLEREILNFRRTQEEVPGWLVPQYYVDYLKSGDAQPLEGVFYHNAVDILSLAGLFLFTAELLEEPFSASDIHSLDLAAIAQLYQELGDLEGAVQLYEKSIAQGLPHSFFLKTLHTYGHLHRKRGEFEAAIRVWERAANEGMVDSCIELAKYYEHTCRDHLTAVSWAEKALTILPNVESSQDRITRDELIHRICRLRGKIQKQESRS